jgi:uncharacterized protein YaiI (UPF0178 family)
MDSRGKPEIYVDADGCPVRREVFRVASRYGLEVILVSNSWMRIPESDRIRLEVVESGENVADDWIAERAGAGDLVVTGDIPLAARCMKTGASVLGFTGKPFTEDNIGDILATRNLFADLREQGMIIRGPSPLQGQDRSRFLRVLDEMLNRLMRTGQKG